MGVWTVVMKVILLLLLVLVVIVSYKALSHLWGVYLANPPTPAPLHPCPPPTPDHTSMSLTPRGLGCTEGVGWGGGHMGVWTIVMKGIGSTNTNSNSIL